MGKVHFIQIIKSNQIKWTTNNDDKIGEEVEWHYSIDVKSEISFHTTFTAD